jgi:uncharacterized protein (TIGR01370 family)
LRTFGKRTIISKIYTGILTGSLFVLSLILAGCAGAGGAGESSFGSGYSSGLSDSNPNSQGLVNGNLPGPPPGSAPSSAPMSGNVTAGLPPPDMQMPVDSTSPAQPSSTKRDISKAYNWSIDLNNAGQSIIPVSTDLVILSPRDTAMASLNLMAYVGNLHSEGVKRVVAVLNVASISKNDSLWNTSWTTQPTDSTLSPSTPSWLVPHNENNSAASDLYMVSYWNPQWQAILEAQIKRLNDAGVDGVCFEGCDNYSDIAAPGPTAATDMAGLIVSLTSAAREVNPNFIVLTMGSEKIVTSLDRNDEKKYLSAIDGVVAQDVFGSVPASVMTDQNQALEIYHQAKKAVFVTSSVQSPNDVSDFIKRSHDAAYIPFVPNVLTKQQ